MLEIEFLKFQQIYWLFLFILIVPIWLWLVWGYTKRKLRSKDFANLKIIEPLSRLPSFRFEIARRFIVTCIITLLVCSLAGLQYYSFDELPLKEQVGIVVCLDISRSMTAEELYFGEGGRLGAAKREIEDFVSHLSPGYRLGLLVFAGNILDNLPPLTSKYEDFLLVVRGDALTPDLISDQGTNIEWAIKKAVDMFDEKAKIRIIIFVSDGEEEEGQQTDIESALSYARENKVKIYTIGVGRDTSPIPDYDSEKIGYLKNDNGQVIMTKPDARMLSRIANAAGGVYASYDQKEKLVGTLNQIINEAGVSSRIRIPQWKDLSQGFLLAAILLIILLWLMELKFLKKDKI